MLVPLRVAEPGMLGRSGTRAEDDEEDKRMKKKCRNLIGDGGGWDGGDTVHLPIFSEKQLILEKI